MAHQASDYLSKELGTEVRIDKVDIVIFDRIDIKGVYIEDIRKDTFISVNVIHANIADWNLSAPSVNVSRLELEGGNVYMRKYKGDTTFNYQHILDYFATEKEDTTEAPTFDLTVQSVALKDIRYIYQDQNKDAVEKGMDFNHIDLRHISGQFSDFQFDGSVISMQLKNLQLEERSGLRLMNLSTQLHYDRTLIALESFKLGLNSTQLNADYLSLSTPNGPSDFNDFENKVSFSAHFKNSHLSLHDLAFFVPDLYGLNTVLNLNNMQVNGPVYGMRIDSLDITALDTTVIRGNFKIPEMDDTDSIIFNERIALFRTSISDIQKMGIENLLDSAGKASLASNLKQYKRANVIELTEGEFIGGINDFVVDGHLKSGIGEVSSAYGIKFKFNPIDSLYYYTGNEHPKLGKHIIVKGLDMGVIAKNSKLGKVSGNLRIDGKGFDEKDLDVKFNGPITSLDLYGYVYHNILVKEGRFAQQKFEGVIDIEDDNLALKYDGYVDLRSPIHFNFELSVDSAQVAKLTKKDQEIYQRLETKLKIDMYGTDINKLYGNISLENFKFTDEDDDFDVQQLSITVTRDKASDTITIRSPVVDMDLTGKYDLTDIGHALTEQFAYVLSNVVEDQYNNVSKQDFYRLDINLKNINPILDLFETKTRIAENTHIRSEFDHKDKTFALDINADYIMYDSMRFEEVNIENHFDSTKAMIYYFVERAQLSDSIEVRFVSLESEIKNNIFITSLGWDGTGRIKPGLIAFETEVSKDLHLLTDFRPSFFFLQDNQYKIEKGSRFLWSPEQMVFNGFKISHKNHYLGLEGIISKDPSHWLNINVHEFDLSDLNTLLGEEMNFSGVLNVDGRLADVYNVVKFEAKSTIDRLFVNEYAVGDIRLNTRWNELNKSISVSGDLRRERLKTFTFRGDYFIDKEEDNLKIQAQFDQTDIAFLNAFEDPELYTDIEGILDGVVYVNGELNNPIISGKIDVVKTRLKVPMFNVFFGADGRIELADGEIIANHLKITDQEGNVADAQMQIYHYDWADWNYNVHLDMDNPSITKKFMAMDTEYKEGEYYYGRAYVTGTVSIFGYDGHTEITVDVKTKEGTDLTLPMYGSAELEESSFVVYDSVFFLPDSLKPDDLANEKDKVKRLGMTLGMKFHVTKAAQVKIVFDPLTEDQIVARGRGDLEINMDDFGDLTMFGEYEIKEGAYEMRVKGLVEEDFQLVDGSTIQWSGSPYNALLDVVARFSRMTSLKEIIPPEASGRKSSKELVYGVLRMSNTLADPDLAFDIKAPDTDDLGQKAISEIRANPDELNKQFFALLVLQRFLPRYGNTAEGGNALLSLAETQINSILGGMSESYNLEAGLSDSETTLGVSTQINERTTITTSFGVVSGDDETQGGGNIVGDVDIEYRLNDDGTFTMNFFNETNSSTSASQGHFTQGVSLHYQETFNSTKQFKLLQKFFNLFRKKENRIKFENVDRRSGNWVPVPEKTDSTTTD
ncbi:MAG: translocation/assembly module TamB domain-containing protein [Crocinitomicaceae bacterium]